MEPGKPLRQVLGESQQRAKHLSEKLRNLEQENLELRKSLHSANVLTDNLFLLLRRVTDELNELKREVPA